MLYLALAFTVLWTAAFVYLLTLDAKIKDLRRRINARRTA